MDEIHVHKTKKSICAHFAESPCICAKRKFLSISTRKKVIIDKPFFMLNTRKLRCMEITLI